MSPRAAWRLVQLGFAPVYDYAGGKMDWLSYGLAHEGSALLAGDLVDRSVPTCGLDAPLAEARRRAQEGGHGLCVAVTGGDVVMGLLRGGALDGPDERPVSQAMSFGVSTVRPSEDAGALVQRMARANVEALVVTSPDARLLGLFDRRMAEEALRRRDN
ncbi:MAG: CBS domain-containing protein [Acidimicrobiales bacterium]